MTTIYDEITINNLPGKIKLDLPTEPGSNFLTWLGYAIAAIGGSFILLGPSEIMVSYSGPTFVQFFQLYPGPIATLGFLIVYFGNLMTNSALKTHAEAAKEGMTEKVNIKDEEIPEGFELSFTACEDETNVYLVSLVETIIESNTNQVA